MIEIGTSGWQFDNWKGRFYDDGLARKDWLSVYAETFDAVEVNNTFYQLPEPDKLERWRAQTGPTFTFAVKANRYITHMKKLTDPEEPVQTLYRHVEPLGDQIGPILFQLPPNWHQNAARLDAFLSTLSDDHRHVFEFRDASWFGPETVEILAAHDAAFCIYELGPHRSPQVVTTDFAYVRLHGHDTAYEGRYPSDVLDAWADRVRDWHADGRDVYVYFNNTSGDGHAPFDARRFRQRFEDTADSGA